MRAGVAPRSQYAYLEATGLDFACALSARELRFSQTSGAQSARKIM